MSVNWDDFYKKFEERFRESESLIKERLNFYRPLLEVLIEVSSDSSPLALDLGCGRGEFLELLTELGFKAYGVDLNPLFVEHCKKKGLEVYQEDALSFLKKTSKEKYLLISAIHLLEHLPFEVLVELVICIFSALKPGGIAIFETPNAENLIVGTRNFWLDPTHLKPLHPEFLKFLCEYAGFKETYLFYLHGAQNLKKPTIKDILQSASQDYAFLALKEPQNLETYSQISQTFKKLSLFQSLGTLELAEAFDQKFYAKVQKLIKNYQELSNICQELKARLDALWFSKPWKLYQLLGKAKRKIVSLINLFPFLKFSKTLKMQEKKESQESLLSEREKLFYRRIKRLTLSLPKKTPFLPSPNSKPSLAYLSPLPPAKSGIACYSLELLSYLKNYYEITLVTNQKEILPSLKNQFPVLSPEEFLKKGFLFDRALYHFGNSPFHAYMIDLLEEIPGVVVLHDVFLSDLVLYAQNSGLKPGFIYQMFYEFGGFSILLEAKEKDPKTLAQIYPLNTFVINKALGLILHSNYSFHLLQKFYSSIDSSKVAVIPPLRTSELQSSTVSLSQNSSGKSTSKEEFLIGSFGILSPYKECEKLIEAFYLFCLSKNPKAKLFLVGEPVSSEYYKVLDEKIKDLGLYDKVFITGWVEDETYQSYLQKVDLVVQLRRDSRGEVSRALLDAFSAGKPVIVNAHGYFEEIPHSVVFKISENFSVEELSKALEKLYYDKLLRDSLSLKAKEFLYENFNPSKIANLYFQTIENFYQKSLEINFYQSLTQEQNSLISLAKNLSEKVHPPFRKKQLLVDISALAREDLQTGIQRVVKAQLKYLFLSPPPGFRIEPVYLTDELGFWTLKYAQKFASSFLSLSETPLEDTLVEPYPEDIYYVPDLFGWGVCEVYRHTQLYSNLKKRKVKIVFLVYDLLPVRFPEYFPEGAKEVHACYLEAVLKVADKILCISKATAEDLVSFGKELGLQIKNLNIEILPLGADFEKVPHKELDPKEMSLLEVLKNQKFFLMVGTVEPRKGHHLVISAFELLWKENFEVSLVIVGKEGWMVKPLIQKIKSHPEFGKKLFFTGQISDTLLANLYKKALATICASEGEGFGLPIVESFFYQTPVIARNLPVFKELGKEQVFYFENTSNPEVLAKTIKDWLSLYEKGLHPKPNYLKILTWQEHTEKLKKYLLNLK